MKNYPPIFILILLLVSCGKKSNEIRNSTETSPSDSIVNKSIQQNPLKQAYFGETHMHSKYSLDAYIGGNRFSPDESLRFAQGEAIQLEKFGKTWQLKRPLDFAAVTDHAEYIGESYTILTPEAEGYDSEAVEKIKEIGNVDGLTEQLKHLEEKVNHYDFEGAMEILYEIKIS